MGIIWVLVHKAGGQMESNKAWDMLGTVHGTERARREMAGGTVVCLPSQ